MLRAVAMQRDLVVSTLKEFASNKFKCIGPVGGGRPMDVRKPSKGLFQISPRHC